MKRLEAMILDSRRASRTSVAWLGTSVRFYPPLDQQLPQANFAQFVVLAAVWRTGARETGSPLHEVAPALRRDPDGVTRFRERAAGRLSGAVPGQPKYIDRVLRLRSRWRRRCARNPNVTNVNPDWDEPSRSCAPGRSDQRARWREPAALAKFAAGSLSGLHVSTYREGNETIEVVLRGPDDERARSTCSAALPFPPPAAVGAPGAGGDAGGRVRGRHHLAPVTAPAHGHRTRLALAPNPAVVVVANRADAGGHSPARRRPRATGSTGRQRGRGLGARAELD